MLLPPIGGRYGPDSTGTSRSPSRGGSRAASPSPQTEAMTTATSASYAEVRRSQQIKAKFKELDVNKDGTLSFQELSGILKRITHGTSKEMTESKVHKLFNQLDKNHDDKVSFDEFVDFLYGTNADLSSELRREFEAAVERRICNLAKGAFDPERTAAAESGRERLGRLYGTYNFRWIGGDLEHESVQLVLESTGRYTLVSTSGLDAHLSETTTEAGDWEVSASEAKVLLYATAAAGRCQRLALVDDGSLDPGKDGPLSGTQIILKLDDDENCLQ